MNVLLIWLLHNFQQQQKAWYDTSLDDINAIKCKRFAHSFFQFRMRLYVDGYDYDDDGDDDDELNGCKR